MSDQPLITITHDATRGTTRLMGPALASVSTEPDGWDGVIATATLFIRMGCAVTVRRTR